LEASRTKARTGKQEGLFATPLPEEYLSPPSPIGLAEHVYHYSLLQDLLKAITLRTDTVFFST
jgi:hypothetical protein